MTYIIKSIKHTGNYGERGTDRTDGRYPLRIGRTCYLEYPAVPGNLLIINYLRDSNGSGLLGRYLMTSLIIDVNKTDNKLIVETVNSIYEFEECNE